MMIQKDVEILNSVRGQLLVAMPQIEDGRFKQAVILMCQHDDQAAMGVVINKPHQKLDLNGLREKLSLSQAQFDGDMPIYAGGPVEAGRGFVLHSVDQMLPDSLPVGRDLALSFQVSIIDEIASGTGPMQHRIMLGYAGWDEGQLEEELKDGVWFHLEASPELIFDTPPELLWQSCFAAKGFNAASLSPDAGSA
ncbi:MAG: YqgE/AlgH family protein [Candidatus Puniceispirillaceae bacterium]